MLPPGHAAAGILVAAVINKYFGLNLTPHEQKIMLGVGALFAFIPDLDMFYAFFRVGRFIQPVKKINHRKFITHTPLFWIMVGISVFYFNQNPFGFILALTIAFSAISHLFFDSLEYGVMWLWPFSKNQYAMFNSKLTHDYKENSFLDFWFGFLKVYATKMKPTFYTELVLLLLVVLFLFR